MGTVDARQVFDQIISLVRSRHSDERHSGMIGSCLPCNSYLDELAGDPRRLGLSEWPSRTISSARELFRLDRMTDIGVTVDVKEVRENAPESRMDATIRSGVWSASAVVQIEFRGGNVMSVETAEMFRAALDLAIRACGGR